MSLDDDSYPVDRDFFLQVERLFAKYSRAAVFGAQIWQRQEEPKVRHDRVFPAADYVGCGHAIRVSAYRQIRGYLALPVAFRMEEGDVSLQLAAAGWELYSAGQLRVFHDTDLMHRESPEVTSATITNVGLCAFLHYPLMGSVWGVAQVINAAVWHLRRGKVRGIWSGLFRIPVECYRNREHRKPVLWKLLRHHLRARRVVAPN